MSDLLARIKELKGIPEMSDFAEQIKGEINNIPKFDNDLVTSALQTALLSLFNTQNAIDEQRKAKIIGGLDDLSKKIDQSEKHFDRFTKLENQIKQVQSQVNAIRMPETDLSGVEKSIKNIKVVDLSALENRVSALSKTIASIKVPEANFKPVLDAIGKVLIALNEPKTKTVTFEIVKDRWGFPTKVIAREN